ncbi:MAG: hypothetical protein R2747_05920 [Pyrinomonadaceae bacterium]
MSCSQCGAYIKRVRVRENFAECEYCGSLIPVLSEKVVLVPNQQPTKPKLRKLTEKEKKDLFKSVDERDVPFFDEDTETFLKVSGFIVVLALLFVIPIILQNSF